MSRRRQWGEDSTVTIDLSSGGSVTLTFKGNLFDLTADERRLISDLSSIIQKYRDAEIEPGRLAAAVLAEEVQHG
jgi:hypothetical protein